MKKLIILAIAIMLTACTLPATQPEQPKTEPPKIVKSGGYIFVPKTVDSVPAQPGTFLDESGTVRWVPIEIEGVEGSRLMVFPQPKPVEKEEP